MATKKYLSYERLKEYDELLKAEIDSKVSEIINGDTTVKEAEKATKDGSDNIIAETYETKEDAKIKFDEANAYTDAKTENLISASDVDSKIAAHNVSENSHEDIRNLISGLTTRLNTLANSDDTTLDQMKEVVDYIKSNKSLIDSITTNKVNVSDIVDGLTSNSSSKVLSAKQGFVIKGLIDGLQEDVNGKADSAHDHDERYYTETEIDNKITAINASIETVQEYADTKTQVQIITWGADD